MFLTSDIKYDIVVANSNDECVFTPICGEVLITTLTEVELKQLGYEPIYPFGNYMIYRGEDDYYCASKRDFGNMPILFVQYLKVLEAVANIHRNEDKMYYRGMELDTVEKLLDATDLTRILLSNSEEEVINLYDDVFIYDWTVTVNLVEQKVCHYCNKQLVHEDYYPNLDVLCRELNFSSATDWLVFTDDYYWNRDIFNFLDDLFSNADNYNYHAPKNERNHCCLNAYNALSQKIGTYYLFQFQNGPAFVILSVDELKKHQLTAFKALERIWKFLFTEDDQFAKTTVYMVEITNIINGRPFGQVEQILGKQELENVVDKLDHIVM